MGFIFSLKNRVYLYICRLCCTAFNKHKLYTFKNNFNIRKISTRPKNLENHIKSFFKEISKTYADNKKKKIHITLHSIYLNA